MPVRLNSFCSFGFHWSAPWSPLRSRVCWKNALLMPAGTFAVVGVLPSPVMVASGGYSRRWYSRRIRCRRVQCPVCRGWLRSMRQSSHCRFSNSIGSSRVGCFFGSGRCSCSRSSRVWCFSAGLTVDVYVRSRCRRSILRRCVLPVFYTLPSVR